ncbi:MAG: hypothetical protein ACREUU_00815, partial [Gammaproteobacteria bacterium]
MRRPRVGTLSRPAVWVLAGLAALLSSTLTGFAQMPVESPLSPAEQKIAWAEQAITDTPDQPQLYNELALALTRRARETADPNYYL